jgi:hypothetical protein
MYKDSSIQSRTMAAPDKRRVAVPSCIWNDTWIGLRLRGQGRKESAAVWAGCRHNNDERVEAVYFLDDYAGGEQCRGYHRVDVEALTEFFVTLQRQKQVIIADIHTHPTDWVGLSPLDESNPIEFRVGLPAIVLPSFAEPEPSWSISGVHIYRGNGRWRTLDQLQKEELFAFE